jgi:diketogulonate reductase-like aldo/keto reductase
MINIMAYSPMSKDALVDEQICKIANDHGCSSSAVILSWILNTGSSLAVKSVSHMIDNLDSHFILSESAFNSMQDKNIPIIQER